MQLQLPMQLPMQLYGIYDFVIEHLLQYLIHEWRDWDTDEDGGVSFEEIKPILEEKADINVFQEKFKLLMKQLDENENGMVDRIGKICPFSGVNFQ